MLYNYILIIFFIFLCLVVGPISCNAKLKLHMNPENDIPAYVDPKIDLDLEMETLNVGMTNTQFTTLLQLVDAMNRMQLGRPYRAYRPYGIRKCGNVYCTTS